MPRNPTKVVEMWVEGIIVPSDRMRSLNTERVAELAKSMAKVGQINPILIQKSTDVLVAGLHRIEAAKSLGWINIDAIQVQYDDVKSRLVEIAENLHRSDLTVLERSKHEVEWIRLTEASQSAQLAPFESKRPDGKGHRHESGINAAVRELGIERTQAQRAIRIADITPEAHEAACAAGLDNNQSALLKVASYAAEDQVEAVADIVKKKAAKLAPVSMNDFETREQWMSKIMGIWNRGSAEWREHFLSRIDKSIMDKRFG